MIDIIREYDDNDLEMIKWQLDTGTVNIIGVVERCEYNHPSIIALDPLKDNDGKDLEGDKLNYGAISSFLWLTCPYLHREIHKIESEGYIDKIEDFINDDYELQFKMKNAHANYYYLRKKFYNHIFQDNPDGMDYINVLETGIGGIKDIEYIKCLHHHYTHYKLYEENIAGKIAFFLLNGSTSCLEEICENDS